MSTIAEPKYIGVSKYIGVYCAHKVLDSFWTFTCPCGVSVSYGLNKLPETTTAFPCGNPNHFLIKIGLPNESD